MKLTEMKIRYKPNSRRSMTTPIICHSCEVFVPWQCSSIWWRIAMRSLLSFLSSSKVSCGGVFSWGVSAESVWSSLAEMMPPFIALSVRNQVVVLNTWLSRFPIKHTVKETTIIKCNTIEVLLRVYSDLWFIGFVPIRGLNNTMQCCKQMSFANQVFSHCSEILSGGRSSLPAKKK